MRNLFEGWELVGQSIRIGEFTGPGLFLGWFHERFMVKMCNTMVIGFRYNMTPYLPGTVARYCELVEKMNSKLVNVLTRGQCRVPFFPEANNNFIAAELSLSIARWLSALIAIVHFPFGGEDGWSRAW